MPDLRKTDKSKVKRLAARGAYDRETVYAILDAGALCHVAYAIDGEPYCTPTLYWREDDHVYWHGSSISRFLQQVEGKSVCLTVTHFDGLVLARSAFHHSANYRSAMLFGAVEVVPDAEKPARLQAFVERMYPGRWDILRPMTDKEAAITTVVRMRIDEGSAKVRTGGPSDDADDYALPIWAGVIPLILMPGKPISDPRNLDGVEPPDHVANFQLGI